MSLKMNPQIETSPLNKKLNFIVDSLSVYVSYFDAKTLQYLFVNKLYTQAYDKRREKIIGSTMKDILSEENYKNAHPHIDAVRRGEHTSYEYYFNVPIGLRWVKVDYVPEFDASGNVVAFIAIGTDITERKIAEEKMKKSETRYRFIVETASEGIMVLNKNFIIEYVNNKLESMLSYPANDLLGKNFRTLLFKKDLKSFELQVKKRMQGEGAAYEKFLKTKNATGHWSLISAKPIMDDNKNFDGVFVMLTDIHSRKQLGKKLEKVIKKLKHLSDTDELTGLVNRRYFNKIAFTKHPKLAHKQGQWSFIMLDIDQFKEFNDYYGHLQGDLCLQKVAGVLTKNIHGKFDIVSRYGGDEFLCLLSERSLKDMESLAKKIVRDVENLHIEHKKSLVSSYVTISLGLAITNCDTTLNVMNCIKTADNALYEAKTSGRNRVVLCNYTGAS